MTKLLGLIILVLLFFVPAQAQDLEKVFHNHKAAFAVYDIKNNSYKRYNESRCQQRFSPFSTFKIPNSLIGLETGVIPNLDFTIAWDQIKYPKEKSVLPEWNQDHTLRSAFKYSVVWYYQELAKKVGEERMQSYINKFHYGNQDISSGIDQFWLGKSLQISANEQIDFLTSLYKNKLPLSQKTIDGVKEIMLKEETSNYKIYSKTGSGYLPDNQAFVWLVGFVETKDDTYIFATNMSGKNLNKLIKERVEITKQALIEVGVIKN